jgi:hypothetical protein
MTNKEDSRLSIWLIDNVVFSGNEFVKEVEFENQTISILITDYENSKKLPEPFNDWIHNKIINYGMMNSTNSPLPVNSIFVITKDWYSHENSYNFSLLMKLCLKLVYYPPTLVSHTAEYIPDAAISLPTWDGWKNSKPISKNIINPESFDLVIQYFNILNSKKIKFHHSLEQIYNIANINDILIELLSLWSFIEGFWNTNVGDSKLDQSLLNMLEKDFAPGKTRKDKEIRDITQTILSQNSQIGARNYSELRNILAHGEFLKLENSWTDEQWVAIQSQRNLLIEIVIKSLVNYIRNVA